MLKSNLIGPNIQKTRYSNEKSNADCYKTGNYTSVLGNETPISL